MDTAGTSGVAPLIERDSELVVYEIIYYEFVKTALFASLKKSQKFVASILCMMLSKGIELLSPDGTPTNVFKQTDPNFLKIVNSKISVRLLAKGRAYRLEVVRPANTLAGSLEFKVVIRISKNCCCKNLKSTNVIIIRGVKSSTSITLHYNLSCGVTFSREEL